VTQHDRSFCLFLHDALVAVVGRHDRRTGGAVAIPAEYLEVVATRRD
jgi:hypothetical protein